MLRNPASASGRRLSWDGGINEVVVLTAAAGRRRPFWRSNHCALVLGSVVPMRHNDWSLSGSSGCLPMCGGNGHLGGDPARFETLDDEVDPERELPRGDGHSTE
jgi:hypothetical protein